MKTHLNYYNPMKIIYKLFVLICMLSANLSIAQKITSYKIEGYIIGLANNSKIYLINGGQRKTIDSAIVTNERFVLSRKLSEPIPAYL